VVGKTSHWHYLSKLGGKMNWYNEPTTWTQQEDKLIVTANGKTDFWRVTLHGFIKDDAHFYYQAVTGDFTATVQVTGAYASLYDQAGLMVRESETVWLKCGIEYLAGVQQASAVITRDFSDWSIVPLTDNPTAIWIRVKRSGAAVEVFFSQDDEVYTLIRQGYLSEEPTLQVGLMCAAPQGDGFEVTFEDFSVG
jgi:regulation of enolase protein 1 (concanavalin A-like superfamily)